MHSFISLFLVTLAALAVMALAIAWAKGFHRAANPVRSFLAFAFHAPLGFATGMALANVAEGQSLTGLKNFAADVVVAGRYRIGKIGSSAANITLIAAVTDKPLAIMQDEAAAIGDYMNCAVLGATVGTLKVALNSTVALGDTLTVDATGYARTLPTADGTYWIFGAALQAGVAGDIIEFAPCFPRQIQYATAVATSRL